MAEIWKPIDTYEGEYEISSFGRVFSNKTKTILTPDKNRGYLRVTLFRKGKRDKRFVHTLVAKAFIPNPLRKPFVNHLDENRANNNVNNLEWCTAKENCNYGNRNRKISQSVAKPVKQLSKDGKVIRVWESMTDASISLNIQLSEISVCTRKHNKSAGGYKWRCCNASN